MAAPSPRPQRRKLQKQKRPIGQDSGRNIVVKSSADTKREVDRLVGTLQFPHEKPHKSRINYRNMASIILVVLIALSLYAKIKNAAIDQKYTTIKKQLLANPLDSQAHIKMGEYLESNNNFSEAKKEYEIAQTFSATDAAQHLKQLQAKIEGPTVVQQSLQTWLAFVNAHPNYADGWAYLASLYWRLGERGNYQMALNSALAIDPQNLAAHQLQLIQTKP